MSAKDIEIKVIPTTKIVEKIEQNICKIQVGDGPLMRRLDGEKVLMLVGATGTGKSTLINAFVNYIYGVEYKDSYRYRLIADEGKCSQAHGQTKSITAYTFPNEESQPRLPFPLTIVDTPGYGDPEGIQRDKEITEQIKEFFSLKGKDGIDHINGVVFVAQASLPRLTPTMKYIFSSILSIFGNDIKENIFLMVTFADGKKPRVINALKEQDIHFQAVFKFNNSALFPDEENADTSDDDDDDDQFSEMFWKMGDTNFKNFFDVLGKTQPVSLQLTKEVLQERAQLECLVKSLPIQIRAGLHKIDQLREEESVLKEHQKDIEINKKFKYQRDETRQRKVDLRLGQHVTNCLPCNMTCHPDCSIPNDDGKRGCVAMDQSGYCKICPQKCFWDKHVNNPYKFELYTVTVWMTYENLLARYETAKGKMEQVEAVKAGLKDELAKTQFSVLAIISKAKECIAKLEKIALKPNPLSEGEYIDLLIQNEESEAKEGFLKRVKALKEIRKQAEVLSKIKSEDVEKFQGAACNIWESFFSK